MALRTDLGKVGREYRFIKKRLRSDRDGERWVSQTAGSLIDTVGSLRGYSENNVICSKVSGSWGCGCTVSVSVQKRQCSVCFKLVGYTACVRSG